MNIFRNSNTKTAKEHLNSKRNNALFVDLKNNPKKNKLTCIKKDKIDRFVNHSSLINLRKGYYDYYQDGKCVTRNEDYLTNYKVENFKKECGFKVVDNTDLNYNYEGQNVNGNDETKINGVIYTEKNVTIFPDNNVNFPDKNKFNEIKCFDLHSRKMKEM